MASKGGASQWPEWMKPGVRVVRGPDWRGTVRDNSTVILGTLSYVPKQASESKVNVVWDRGTERSYYSGFKGNYELRAYDLQQVGIVHKKATCNTCDASPLRGTCYHCAECNKDVCTKCYHNDQHDTSHSFVRIDTPSSQSVNLPPRAISTKLGLLGVFEGSDVIRGPHFNYPDKEGSGAEKAVVKSFVDMKDGVSNGWVRICWEIGKTIEEYRFGAGGYVDLVGTKLSKGGSVYVDHLPLVGIIALNVGDKVAVNMSEKEFKDAQIKAKVPDGWKDGMKKCLKETGTIIELLFDGDMANVQYQDSTIYIVCRMALFRKSGFFTQGVVSIITNVKQMKKLQGGRYCADMDKTCGRVGRILEIQDDGDMMIYIETMKLLFSPTCCEPVDDQKQRDQAPDMPSSDDEEEEEQADSLQSLMPEGDCVGGRTVRDAGIDKKELTDFRTKMGSLHGSMMKMTDQDQSNKMFDAFNKADLKTVMDLIKKNKSLLCLTMESRTILHLACHEGYKDLVTFLIDSGADMNKKDEEGDTPLHYAAFGKQPDCVQEMLQNAADPNAQNRNGITPLIIAINHPCIDSVQCLIINNADVNITNSDGDTAMHDAVEQKDGQPVITKAVLGASMANFSVVNAKNFNILHWAAIKDNKAAVRMVLEKDSSIVDVPLGGGFTALHVAATNDFVEVTSILLDLGGADPSFQDAEGRTALHIAVAQANKRIIEVLVEKKADVNAQDNHGDTPLHYSQRKSENLTASRRKVAGNRDINIQIVYFLLEKGADLYKQNKNGKTPLDLVEDGTVKTMLEKLTASYKSAPVKSQRGVRLPIHWQNAGADLMVILLDKSVTTQKQEFDEVEKQFQKTMPGTKLERVKRVENPLLWEHYTLKKREMEMKYGQGCANESHLYHGTSPEIVDIIAKDNFDFRIAGSRVGALYGNGAYFATTAKYSDLYASADSQGYKVMFVAKVLAGKSCAGKPGLTRPPEVDPNNYKMGMYDCTVNNVLSPTIFCVFDRNQYYPEYIVEYQ